MKSKENFGLNIKSRRNYLGLTRDMVVERSGIALATIAPIEQLKPNTNPTIEVMIKIARALRTPLWVLLMPDYSPTIGDKYINETLKNYNELNIENKNKVDTYIADLIKLQNLS